MTKANPIETDRGDAASSTGKILYSGTVTPNFVVATGVTPKLSAALQGVDAGFRWSRR